jgi:RimJ/RimL family protein N-acetyltransferase
VDTLADMWPLYGLMIQTSRLTLRLAREDDLPRLTAAARVISNPGEPQLHLRWMYDPTPEMERQFLQRHWRSLAHWKPDSWYLPLTLYLDGQPIGVQSIWASDFARLRSAGTGSWITRTQQGHGYGTEARAAVLELAFARLSAEEACTEYIEGNHASARVSRKLGYTGNGQHTIYRNDTRLTEYRLRLDRLAWTQHRSGIPCTITGIEPCLDLFGAPATTALTTRPARTGSAVGDHVHGPARWPR